MTYNSLAEEAIDTRRKREWLIQSLRTHLVPRLNELGFQQAPLVLHPPVNHEFTRTFPLEQLIRNRAEAVDIVRIQFAPYREAAIRINVGKGLARGLVMYKGQQSFDGAFIVRFEMYQFPRLWGFLYFAWFKVRSSPFHTPTQHDYEKLAKRVAGYSPEIELALREDKLGPHVRRAGIPASANEVGDRAP